MNLREVREAAERLLGHYDVTVHDDAKVAKYAIVTIDPSPDDKVDSEWLKEEWGAWRHMQPTSSFNLTIGTGAIRLIYYFDFDPSKVKWSINTDDDAMWLPLNIKSRQQFTQLALALGINKIKRVSECANTR